MRVTHVVVALVVSASAGCAEPSSSARAGTAGESGGPPSVGHEREQDELGTLARVRSAEQPVPEQEPTNVSSPQRVVDEPEGELVPVSLTARRFDPGAGFCIHPVPQGVSVWQVVNRTRTWELRDADGNRLALIAAEPWSRAARPDEPPLVQRSEPRGHRVQVPNWGGGPADVKLERLASEQYLYRIERRAGADTEWIHSRWCFECCGESDASALHDLRFWRHGWGERRKPWDGAGNGRGGWRWSPERRAGSGVRWRGASLRAG